ncbi:poly-beta-1,6-N-acetyl-D-glucosamine N-deacetylase PgaB [Lysobacter sp. N42]|nr:poly-beta-1,6-N-acetyl-D-glucosamine N-deacetylase PgaB [Lysobacter sp. N42]TCZ88112.1 poly-beta-1,6-N-acetyl-D-glucosamine N-deacetylase PgaB [Lysobacter sp. N42]
MRLVLLLSVLLLGLLLPGRADALLVLSYHDIRDDVAPKGDPDPFAVSTRNFAMHLDWLRAHGYVPVSAQAVREARAGRRSLPDKAVLITFDDGLRSTYTHAYPLLRSYGYPALVAVVTSWMDLPADARVPYGSRDFTREDFLTWEQLREMQASGLVEVGSHSHALHSGVPGNPQGNQMPAAITRRWERGYEPEAAYRERIRKDLAESARLIEKHLGRRPQVMVWPYAAYNRVSNAIAADLGMGMSFDLEGRSAGLDRAGPGADGSGGDSLARLLMYDNPDITDFVYELRRDVRRNGIRAIQVDLDYVYDPDPAQTERNLGVLVERIHRIRPTHVYLQAFADPDGDGAAEALYFPNRHMPMRADLFNRAAWQLRTRANVAVYAWMPVLGFELPDAARQQRLRIAASNPAEIPRLDPTRPETAELVGDLYEDLAISSHFTGLLFHDDAYVREDETLADGSTGAARTQRLIDFTGRLEARAEHWRPKLVTVRNLFAQPVLQPASEAWFAQQLPAFNRAYDYTALMAMPYMENAADPTGWLETLVRRVAASPQGLDRTIFELQATDWRVSRPVPVDAMEAQARRVLALGGRHLAYYPDDFLKDRPPLESARAVMSARAFPYLER